jgi:hypothetical protein
VFLVLVFVELAVALGLRSLKSSVATVRPDKFLCLAAFMAAILTIILIATPAVREAFRATPTLTDIGIVALWSAMALTLTEGLKRVLRKI